MAFIKSTINAQGTEISVLSSAKSEDYISLTDIARYRNPDEPSAVIGNWLRNRSTIEFLGLWEELNNPTFNSLEFEGIKNESGANAFTLSPKKWISSTNAIGVISKSGRYGSGAFAHKDIAFEFASWISPGFKLYVIKDYQRLKESEHHIDAVDWNVKRLLTKVNYRLHTDAVKENLIPDDLPQNEQKFIYANEADVLNMALFGKTASQWRIENVGKEGNMRDYATIEQLLVMTNLESSNALLIQQGKSQMERLQILRNLAISQLTQLSGLKSTKQLNDLYNQPQLPQNEYSDFNQNLKKALDYKEATSN